MPSAKVYIYVGATLNIFITACKFQYLYIYLIYIYIFLIIKFHLLNIIISQNTLISNNYHDNSNSCPMKSFKFY